MTQETELQKLERFVEKLLVKFSDLKAQNGKLQLKLQERDQEIEKLQGNLSSNDNERTEISQRVNKLVEQIEEWELSLDEEGQPIDEDEETLIAQDEVDEMDEAEDTAEEEESRVQHNLFSMSGSEEEAAK